MCEWAVLRKITRRSATKNFVGPPTCSRVNSRLSSSICAIRSGSNRAISMPASRRREFPATTDRIVRIEHADDDACDSAFDDSFSAWDLGAVSRRAWFQCREEGRTRQRLVPELGFEKRELGVVSGSEFASEGLAQHHTFPRDDSSDPGRNTPLFAHALPCERDGSLHERSFTLRRAMVDGHCPMLLAISAAAAGLTMRARPEARPASRRASKSRR